MKRDKYAENGNALICLKWALKGLGQVLSAKTVSTPRCKAVQSVSVDSADGSRWVNLFLPRVLGILGIAGALTCGAGTTEGTESTEPGLWLGVDETFLPQITRIFGIAGVVDGGSDLRCSDHTAQLKFSLGGEREKLAETKWNEVKRLGIYGTGVVAGALTCGALTTDCSDFWDSGDCWCFDLRCWNHTAQLKFSLGGEREKLAETKWNEVKRHGKHGTGVVAWALTCGAGTTEGSEGTEGSELGRWNGTGNFTTIY